MKHFKLLFLGLLAAAIIISCNKDDDDDDNGNGNGNGNSNESSEADYIDQTAQGSVFGTDFTTEFSVAQQTELQGPLLTIRLYGDPTEGENYCSPIINNSEMIILLIPFSEGEHELSANNGYNAQFYAPVNQQDVVSDGWVNITSIDTVNATVTGMVDIDGDAEKYVNGSFEAILCE